MAAWLQEQARVMREESDWDSVTYGCTSAQQGTLGNLYRRMQDQADKLFDRAGLLDRQAQAS